MIPLQQAIDTVLAQCKGFGTETIALEHALGRVLAKSVLADRNYPPFNRASMDGYAIHKSDWDEGIRTFNIVGELLAGAKFEESLASKQPALRIMTGAATPASYDVIIKVEESEAHDSKVSFNIDAVKNFQNIAKEGEDVLKGALVMDSSQEIKLGSLTALASVGASALEVFSLPKITIITTGNEVVPIGSTPQEQQIRNSNALTLQAALQKLGIREITHMHVGDAISEIRQTLEKQIDQADIILFTGGVSAGSADFVPQVLQESGFEKLFHKIKIKPGKPAWFGTQKASGKVVFALPGNPLSVMATFKILVEPFILKSIGKSEVNYGWKCIAVNRVQRVALDEFFPYLVTNSGNNAFVEPLQLNGSGDITATLRASGLALHPIDTKELTAGSFVKVYEF